jgi:predicted secreted acid phosphatase
MKMNIAMYHALSDVVGLCVVAGARQATKYVSNKNGGQVVTATRRHRPRKYDDMMEIVLKVGRPNWKEQRFIRLCERAKEKFPVRKVQIKWYPKR